MMLIIVNMVVIVILMIIVMVRNLMPESFRSCFFLLYGIAHFLWASSFALALLQFEFSIIEVFIILSPKKEIF